MYLERGRLFNRSSPPFVKAEPLHYPYLLDEAAYDSGQINEYRLKVLLKAYCDTYLKLIQRQGEERELERLRRAFSDDWDNVNWPNGSFGTRDLAEAARHTVDHYPFHFRVGLTHGYWEVRRLGRCLGIKVCHGRDHGEEHKDSTAVFEHLIEEQLASTWLKLYRAFWQYSLETSPRLDITNFKTPFEWRHEMRDLTHYVPDIKWWEAEETGPVLIDHFVGAQESIEIGRYYGIAVHARLLLERHPDSVWRKSAMEERAATSFVFPTEDIRGLTIQYSVQSAWNKSSEDRRGIDHSLIMPIEQELMRNAMRVLFSGLYERQVRRDTDERPDLFLFRR